MVEKQQAEFKEKFVAFVDILGFTSAVEASERGQGRTLEDILTLLGYLERKGSLEFVNADGPMVCPESVWTTRDLDFKITRISDCSVISAELSPAGAINLLYHCYSLAAKLLAAGILVRGYITRGSIYHSGTDFIGSGYHHALRGEKDVLAFIRDPHERGSPFIEVDHSFSDYLEVSGDKCTAEVLERLTVSDGESTVVFPFKRLVPPFLFQTSPLDVDAERKRISDIRKWIGQTKGRLREYSNSVGRAASAKISHYERQLDDQLAKCDDAEKLLDMLLQPFPGPYRE
jgi:hypothetical protein